MGRYILIFVFLMPLHSRDAQAPAAEAKIVHYRVSLPHMRLKTECGEKIDSVQVTMDCGRFVAINRIPDDWSVEMVSPVSEQTELTMTAGHGSTALWHSEELDGFATLLVSEDAQSCFDIKALVSTSFYTGCGYGERKAQFSRNRLVLKREAAPSNPPR